MFEIRLHGALWKKASAERRGEWTTTLDELNAENSIEVNAKHAVDEPALELVQHPSGDFLFRLYDGAFDRVAQNTMSPAELRPHFDDYTRAIREMKHLHDSAPTRGFETLDYAKRVVHEEGAELVQKSLKPLVSVPFADARRIFTLLFLIESDLPEKDVRFHKFHF